MKQVLSSSGKYLIWDTNSLFCPALSSVHETFPAVSWCHTLFAPKVVCPKSCTKLYQEREKVPSLENASTTPTGISGKGLQVHTITVKTIFMFWDKQGNIEHSHKCLLKDLMKLSVEYITSSCYRY